MLNFLKSLSPIRLLLITMVVSLITTAISFDFHEFNHDTLLIFALYYLILIIAALLASFGKGRLNTYTNGIVQLGFIFLGFSLAFISLVQILKGSLVTFVTGFFLTGLPGLALIWAGIQLFRPEKKKPVE